MPIQNKVGAFLANPTLYRILAEPEKTLNFRRIMDEGKIVVINLAKGKIGEDSTALLGGLLVTTLSPAAFSEAEVEKTKRHNFFLYMDEFQYFTTLSMAKMPAELRKYHVGLILANQFLDQLEPEIRDAVLGRDARILSRWSKGRVPYCQRVGSYIRADGLTQPSELPHLPQAHDRHTGRVEPAEEGDGGSREPRFLFDCFGGDPPTPEQRVERRVYG